jgi:hypothetical protein
LILDRSVLDRSDDEDEGVGDFFYGDVDLTGGARKRRTRVVKRKRATKRK